MRVYIVSTLIGIFGINDRKKVVYFKSFGNDPKKSAEKFKLSQIDFVDEEKQSKIQLGKKGYREFIFGYRKPNEKNIENNNIGEKFVKDNLIKLAMEKGFAKTPNEVTQFITKVTIQLTKVHIKKSVTRDGLIIQVNGALEDLDKSINVYIERLREWYGLHFPEINRKISGHEKFIQIVSKYGKRENIKENDLQELINNSMGADLKDEDIEIMRVFATKIQEMINLRESLSKYSEKVLKEVAPNLLNIIGTTLATKIIAKSGGLKKMSRMPSSTIQLIGAEKALFRYLHGKGKSPRHGIIFSHPLIQNSKDENRGKMARLIASKISIASKIDYFSKEFKGNALKDEINRKAKIILSKK